MHRPVAFAAAAGLLLLAGCQSRPHKKLDRRLTLSRNEKSPYGLYYAFETLPSLFPGADIRVNTVSPTMLNYENTPASATEAADSEEQHTGGDTANGETANSGFVPDSSAAAAYAISRRAFIAIARRIEPDGPELSALVGMAQHGEQVLLCGQYLGDSLLRRLGCDVNESGNFGDSCGWTVRGPAGSDSAAFIYPGEKMNDAFSRIDSSNTEVLGWNEYGRPDFIRVGFSGNGAIFLHLAPLAFSNFFLLHKNNRRYYEYALAGMPKNITEVRWDEYFRKRTAASFSAMKFILSQRALRWAFWLIIAMLFLVYVFESKRRQRAQPRIVPPANASVDFVRTVGRLYFQQKDNRDLAVKMIASFLEHLSGRYRIPTAELNDAFSQKLAYRSGQPLEEVQKLVYAIHYARLNPGLQDEELLDLHRRLAAFKKIIS